MKPILKLLAIYTCAFLVGCSQVSSEPDVFKVPKNDVEYQALQEFAHKTIPEGQWTPLCPAPREEIEAKITLIGYNQGWDQDKLDSIREQETERLYGTQIKYAPKPIIDGSKLETDLARGEAIRELEAYDQFWASAIVRYPEFIDGIPEKNRPVFGMLYNRG
ncbi:MAG: hypothetical protein ABJG88_09910, partial [Litorimonas sp.]